LALAALTTGVVLFLSADATAVRAEAAAEPAAYPFTPPVVTAESGQEPEAAAEGTTSGDTPGLYGGTGTNACDADAVARHLDGDQRKAAAWATAQAIGTDQIHGFLASLTAVTLRTDTAVTNHDYRDSQAVPFDSVLQAGSTVLIDQRGVPRVRCICGNPLREAELPPGARYEEAPWRGFSPETVTVVTRAPESVDTFVLLDRDRDEVVARPRGTEGELDTPAGPAEEAAARAFGHQDPAPPSANGPGDEPRGGPDEGVGTDPAPAPGDGGGDGTGEKSGAPLDDGSDPPDGGNDDDPGTVPGDEGSESADDGAEDGPESQPGETGNDTTTRDLPSPGSGPQPSGGTDTESEDSDDGSGDTTNRTDTEDATPSDGGVEDDAGNGNGNGAGTGDGGAGSGPDDGNGNSGGDVADDGAGSGDAADGGREDEAGNGNGLSPDDGGGGTDDGAGDGSGLSPDGTGTGTSSGTVPDADPTD
jgi:hypothetical protein